jgi:hypothetical protein
MGGEDSMSGHALPLRKTRTAAAYIRAHSSSDITRSHAATILRTLASLYAADGASVRADPDLVSELLRAVADCAGSDWLQANTHDPDVGGFIALLEAHHVLPDDPADLDDLLATVLWTRHGPQPAPP